VKRPGKFAGIERNLVLVGLPLINPSTNAQKGDILPGYRLFQGTLIVGKAVDVLWVSTGFFVRVIDMAVAL
jgi:hypothetical protein